MTINTAAKAPTPIYARPMPKAEDFKPLTKVADKTKNHRRGAPKRRKVRTIL